MNPDALEVVDQYMPEKEILSDKRSKQSLILTGIYILHVVKGTPMTKTLCTYDGNLPIILKNRGRGSYVGQR